MPARRRPPADPAPDEAPGWALELAAAVTDVQQRLARLEGGLILAAFVLGIVGVPVVAHLLEAH